MMTSEISTPDKSEPISLIITNSAPRIAISGVIGNPGVENGRSAAGWRFLKIKTPTKVAT